MNSSDQWDNDAPAESLPPQMGIWGLLWRRKWFLALGLVLAVAVGCLYYSQQDSVYESSARIVITRTQPALPTLGLTADVLYAQQQGVLATHALIIRSPLVVRQAVAGFVNPVDDNLRSLMQSIDEELGRSEKGGKKPLSTQQPGLANLPSLAGTDPVSAILGGLAVRQPVESSNVLDLTYRGSHPEDCRTILEAVFQSYKAYLKGTRDTLMRRTYELIDRAKNELDEELAEKETAFRVFRSQNAHLLFKGESGQSFHYERMAGIESARSQLLLRRTRIAAQQKAVEAALQAGGSREALLVMFEQDPDTDSPLTRRRETFKTQLLPLMLEELQLTADFGPDHPEVVALRKRVELTQQVLAEAAAEMGQDEKEPLTPQSILEKYQQTLRQQLATLEAEGQELNTLFEQQQQAAKHLEQLEIEEETLRAEIDRKRQLYDVVIKRLDEISLTDDLGGHDTALISAPSTGAQVEPNLQRILAISVFLGLLGGLALAYFAETADKTFRSPQDIQRALGAPLIGHVPVMDARGARQPNSLSQLDPAVIAAHKPRSPYAEAIRAVRTALFFSTRGQDNQVIQVTSAVSGEGKTTLAVNLAVTIAQSNKQVLLIDADFHRSAIHKLLGMERASGLSSVIEGQVSLPDAVRSTELENLFVMTAGPRTHNPSELLSSPRFQELIGELRDKFEFVIIDSPPMLVVTDSSAVAPRVDGTLLVLRITREARGTASRAAEMLRTLDAKVLGVVVNGVGQKLGYGYGYGYGSAGYRGYGYQTSYGGNGYLDGEADEVGREEVRT